MNQNLCLAVALVAGVVVSAPLLAAAQDVNQRVPYSGSTLRGSKVFLCTSDENAAAGYWFDDAKNAVEKAATITRQTRATTWRITLLEDDAEVIRLSGATQTIEQPEIYSFEVTRTGGLLLVWKDRPEGFSPQTITIDLLNSSFVYSTQHVDSLLLRWNRASIYYGSCKPYV